MMNGIQKTMLVLVYTGTFLLWGVAVLLVIMPLLMSLFASPFSQLEDVQNFEKLEHGFHYVGMGCFGGIGLGFLLKWVAEAPVTRNMSEKRQLGDFLWGPDYWGKEPNPGVSFQGIDSRFALYFGHLILIFLLVGMMDHTFSQSSDSVKQWGTVVINFLVQYNLCMICFGIFWRTCYAYEFKVETETETETKEIPKVTRKPRFSCFSPLFWDCFGQDFWLVLIFAQMTCSVPGPLLGVGLIIGGVEFLNLLIFLKLSLPTN
ncbi:MAG: hypothetical protein Q4C70_01270 [Planctomycetia bacterium]|nr:hypothetical protein [Planctomycetia bacterium]